MMGGGFLIWLEELRIPNEFGAYFCLLPGIASIPFLFLIKLPEIKEKEPLYLLLHYEAKHWDFPKGNVEKGEKDLETVKREISEETGIKDVEIIKDFKEKIHYYYKLKDELISKDVIFYLVKKQ